MKTQLLTGMVTLLLVWNFVRCGGNQTKEINSASKETMRTSNNQTCEDFWAVYNPEDSVKIQLLEEIQSKKNALTAENKKLLKSILNNLKQPYALDSLPLTFEYPLFPIHRLGKEQIGILGYSISKEVNGQWEDFSKEDQLLKKDFGYQSIDSMGVLVSFPKVFDKLYPASKPSVYWYSLQKRNKTNLTEMCYMGDECLSYFHYSFDINEKDKKENIAFGSPFALDLDFVNRPDLDKLFKSQYVASCMDCPSNYKDQKIFAQLKGCNIFFTQSDSWPINNQLDSPSRSMVLLTPDGKLITIWNSELDLFGCGCL